MGKVKTKAVFKQYQPSQLLLLPPDLGELIPENHLVRIVNRVVDKMDLSPIIKEYKGGGSSAYHPSMMIKVMLYAYSMKVYTGRRIAKALRQDITFMWISAYNRPDFRTINLFRSGMMKETIDSLFEKMLLFLFEEGYIKMEDYFCDGSTFLADANKHKVVWKKNAERYKEAALKRCKQLFDEIDELNRKEEGRYGDKDLEEVSAPLPDAATIEKKAKELDEAVANTEDKRKQRKAASLKKKLSEEKSKIGKYEKQEQVCGNRSGYSSTDEDAAVLRMKNQELLPGYNVVAGTENQFITGLSVHQNPNDANCFKGHLEEVLPCQPRQPKSITADSIFGTEQNYELIESKGIENYMKYPTFHQEIKKSFPQKIFLKENFPYDERTDSYLCPNNRKLVFKKERNQTHKKTGYVFRVREYECEDCGNCPFAQECKKGEANRGIKVNSRLDRYREQARKNLESEEGVKKRKRRGHEVETCFGDIKHNMGFRRFNLRGKEKVKTEMAIVALAHNMRKIWAICSHSAA